MRARLEPSSLFQVVAASMKNAFVFNVELVPIEQAVNPEVFIRRDDCVLLGLLNPDGPTICERGPPDYIFDVTGSMRILYGCVKAPTRTRISP